MNTTAKDKFMTEALKEAMLDPRRAEYLVQINKHFKSDQIRTRPLKEEICRSDSANTLEWPDITKSLRTGWMCSMYDPALKEDLWKI